MKHYNSHILELYVLSAPEVSNERDAISAHLDECRGCKDMVDEISRYYEDLAEELGEKQASTAESPLAISTVGRELEEYGRPAQPVITRHRFVGVSKMRQLVRNHPVMSGMGGIGIAVGLGLAIYFANPPAHVDKNPAISLYNSLTSSVEILNKEGEFLWQFKVAGLLSIETQERETGCKKTIIDDLDGDGASEVVTVIEPPSDVSSKVKSLYVYTADGKYSKKEIEEEVKYGNQEYAPYFNPSGVVIRNNNQTKQKEIFVLAQQYGHSPTVLLRLNSRREVIGKYRHFGHLISMILNDFDGDGESELLLCGENDVDDKTTGAYPVLIILDPTKISGEVKSSNSPLYRCPISRAERWYVRFPNSEISKVFHTASQASTVEIEAPDRLIARVGTTMATAGRYDLHYIFDNRLNLIQVRSNDRMTGYVKMLKDEGKDVDLITEEYLEKLKDSILYWDGGKWQQKKTPVLLDQGTVSHTDNSSMLKQ